MSDIVAQCIDWPHHLRTDAGRPPLALDRVTCLSFRKLVNTQLPCRLIFRCFVSQDRLEVQVVISTTLVDKPSATWLAGRRIAAVGVLPEVPRIPLEDVCVQQRQYVIEWS